MIMLAVSRDDIPTPPPSGRRRGEAPTGRDLVHRGYLQILDQLALGVVIVDAARRVVFVNGRAERALQRGDALTVSEGRLRAAEPRGRAGLERLIAAVAAAGNGVEGVLALRRSGAGPVFVLVRPLGGEHAETLILIGDAADAGPRADLGRYYGLTPAEGRLLDGLLRGRSLARHAWTEGASLATVRSQLRQVLAKTGYSRRGQLVGGLLRNPLLHLLRPPESR